MRHSRAFFNHSEDQFIFIFHKTSISLILLNSVELASQEREVEGPSGKRGKKNSHFRTWLLWRLPVKTHSVLLIFLESIKTSQQAGRPCQHFYSIGGASRGRTGNLPMVRPYINRKHRIRTHISLPCLIHGQLGHSLCTVHSDLATADKGESIMN